MFTLSFQENRGIELFWPQSCTAPFINTNDSCRQSLCKEGQCGSAVLRDFGEIQWWQVDNWSKHLICSDVYCHHRFHVIGGFHAISGDTNNNSLICYGNCPWKILPVVSIRLRVNSILASIHDCKMAYSPKAPAPPPNVSKGEVTVSLSILTVYEINVTKWFENFFIAFLGSLTVAHQSHFIT